MLDLNGPNREEPLFHAETQKIAKRIRHDVNHATENYHRRTVRDLAKLLSRN